MDGQSPKTTYRKPLPSYETRAMSKDPKDPKDPRTAGEW